MSGILDKYLDNSGEPPVRQTHILDKYLSEDKEEGFIDKIKRGFKETRSSFRAGKSQMKAALGVTTKRGFEAAFGTPTEEETLKAREQEARKAERLGDLFEKVGLKPVSDYYKRYAKEKAPKFTYDEGIWEHIDKTKITDKFDSIAQKNYEQAKKYQAEIKPDERSLGKKVLDPFWYSKGLAQTLPNMFGAIAVGATATAASGGNPYVGGAAAVGYAAALEGGSAYLEAKEAGASEAQAGKVANIVGGVNGVLEILPIMKFINKSPSGSILKKRLMKEIAKEVVVQGLEEGPTEALQEIVGNTAARIYNPNNPIFTQAVAESGILGFTAGGLTGGAFKMAQIPTEIRADVVVPEMTTGAAPESAMAQVPQMPQTPIRRAPTESGMMFSETPEVTGQTTIAAPEETASQKKARVEKQIREATPQKTGTTADIEGTPLGNVIEEERHGGGLFAQAKEAKIDKDTLQGIVDTVKGLVFEEKVGEAKDLLETIPQSQRPDISDIIEEIQDIRESEMKDAMNQISDKFGEYQKDYNRIKSIIKQKGEVVNKKTGELYREHVPSIGNEMSSDELASALDMTENELMQQILGEVPAGKPKSKVGRTRVARTRQAPVSIGEQNITPQGFDYSFKKEYRLNLEKNSFKEIGAKQKRAAIDSDNVDARIIGNAKGNPIFKITYDPDEALRESGVITESEWSKTGAKMAKLLVSKGVPEDSQVVFDGEMTTLGEMAKGFKKAVTKKSVSATKTTATTPPSQTPPTPSDPKLKQFEEDVLKEIENIKLEDMQPITSEALTSKVVYNNPVTQTAYKLYYKLEDMLTQGKLSRITPGAGRSSLAFNLIREKARVFDSTMMPAREIIKLFSKLSPEEKTKAAEMFHQYIPIEDQYNSSLKKAHGYIGAIGKKMVEIQKKWVKEGHLEEDDVLLPEDVWRAGVGKYGRSFYVNDMDTLGIQRIRPSAYVSSNRVMTSMFKKKLTPEDWGIAALLHEGKVENRNVGGMNTVTDRLATYLQARGITIKQIADMNEQKLLSVLPIAKMKIYAETDPVLMKATDDLMKDLGVSEEQVLKLRGKRLGQFETLSKKIKTMFTATEATRLHEVGHAIDQQYGIQDLFLDNKNKYDRVKIKNELRLVADSRYQRMESSMGAEVSENFKKYVRKGEEKVAEFFSMYITDRKTLKKLAPTAVRVFEEVAMGDPVLQQVIDMRPSRVKGTKTMLASPTNVAKKMIKEANSLVNSDNFVELSDNELKQLGIKAKKENGWINPIDAIISRTIREMSFQMANMLYFDQIVNNPDLYSTKARDGWKDIKGLPAGNGWLGPLRRGFINPDIAPDLETIVVYGSKEQSSDFWDKLVGLFKTAKTSLSVATLIRNYLSGSFIQTDMAGAPIWGISKTGKGNTVANSWTYAKSVEGYITKNQRYKFWESKGLYGSDYFSVEIDKNTLTKIIANKKGNVENIWDKMLEKKSMYDFLMEKTKYYGAIDHVARTYLAEWALQKGLSPVEAVYFANKWQLDYRFVPGIIEALRGGGKGLKSIPGMLVPFISFAYLMTPRILEVLITRPWVLMKYPIAFAALNAYSQVSLGVDDEEKEANMPNFMDSEKDWTVLLPWRDESGDLQYLNMSYTLPFGKPSAKKPWSWAFVDLSEMAKMFLSGAAIWQSGTNIAQNYDPYTDKKVFNEFDSTSEKWVKSLKYLGRTLGPTTLTHLIKLKEALEGKKTGFPIPKKPSVKQATLKTLGVQVYSGGRNTVIWKVKEEEDKQKEIKIQIKKVITDTDLSKAERAAEIKRLNKEIIESQKRIIKLYKGLSVGEKREIDADIKDIIDETLNSDQKPTPVSRIPTGVYGINKNESILEKYLKP